MPGESVPVVLIPRWTTYVGDGTFQTAPVPISAYDRLILNLTSGEIMGLGSAAGIACLESNDLNTWSNCAGGPGNWPPAFDQEQWQITLSKGWLVLEITLSAGASQGIVGVTCHAEGFFELREK